MLEFILVVVVVEKRPAQASWPSRRLGSHDGPPPPRAVIGMTVSGMTDCQSQCMRLLRPSSELLVCPALPFLDGVCFPRPLCRLCPCLAASHSLPLALAVHLQNAPIHCIDVSAGRGASASQDSRQSVSSRR